MKKYVKLFEEHSEVEHIKNICETSSDFKELLKWGYVIKWVDIDYNMWANTKIVYELNIFTEFVTINNEDLKQPNKINNGNTVIHVELTPASLEMKVARRFRWDGRNVYGLQNINSKTHVKFEPKFSYNDKPDGRIASILASFAEVLKKTIKLQYELENSDDAFGEKTGYVLNYDENGHRDKRVDRNLGDTINDLW